jgi:hypothetical protein
LDVLEVNPGKLNWDLGIEYDGLAGITYAADPTFSPPINTILGVAEPAAPGRRSVVFTA